MATTVADDQTGTLISNSLDLLLGYQLRRASAAMLADLTRSLADLGLRVTEASVILLIAEIPGITQSELGRTLGIQRANMAPLTAGLGARSIIGRVRADGRSQALRLSTEGRVLAGTIRRRISEHEARFLPDLSPRERAKLVGVLRRVWVE